MASKLYYLLTYLPSLPELGEPLPKVDVFETIKAENNCKLDKVIDVLELEQKISQIASNYYVDGQQDFEPELPIWLPVRVKKFLLSFTELEEHVWITGAYAYWFDLAYEVAKKVSSSLLKAWAVNEFSLKMSLCNERAKAVYGKSEDIQFESYIPEVKIKAEITEEIENLVSLWKNEQDPMESELISDRGRISFVQKLASHYSFDFDELVAYLIELRIHQRYERLSLEEGQKILKEVTAL